MFVLFTFFDIHTNAKSKRNNNNNNMLERVAIVFTQHTTFRIDQRNSDA